MNCLRGDDAGQIFRGVGWHDACVIFVRLRSTVLVGHPNLGVQVAIRSCRASLRMSWATILRALRWGKWSVRDSCGVYLVSWSRRIRSFCRSRARACCSNAPRYSRSRDFAPILRQHQAILFRPRASGFLGSRLAQARGPRNCVLRRRDSAVASFPMSVLSDPRISRPQNVFAD